MKLIRNNLLFLICITASPIVPVHADDFLTQDNQLSDQVQIVRSLGNEQEIQQVLNRIQGFRRD